MVRLDATPSTSRTPDSVDPVLSPPASVHQDWPVGVPLPPSNLESDEPPLESDLHREQLELLIRLLKYWWRDRNDVYVSGNLTVYYSAEETKTREFRGPDVFVVLGAEPRDRNSWVVWEEQGKYPNVVIELLSDSTAKVDRGMKKDLYESVWRLPEYYWFHPRTLEFQGFRLVNGQYEAILPDEHGCLWSQELELALGLEDRTLRCYSSEGMLIPLPVEAERQAKERAQQQEAQERQAKEQERQAKERAQQQEAQERQAKERAQLGEVQERQAKERLEKYLRAQGIDPNNLPPINDV